MCESQGVRAHRMCTIWCELIPWVCSRSSDQCRTTCLMLKYKYKKYKLEAHIS